MANTAGLLTAIAVLAAATFFGLWRRRTDGRIRAVAAADTDRLSAADLDTELGTRATLVQFSSTICSACDATRRILSAETAEGSGVVHVEIDAEQRLDLARRYSVSRTPTVLILDAAGQIAHRASGAPRRTEVRAVLDALAAA